MDKLKAIVFWGACWGVLEATLGWLMHLIHFKGEVLLLYPFGLLCMMMAFRQTGQVSATVKVAGVAALIKLSNLLIVPTVPVFHVTNPAAAIFLEGCAAWAFCFVVRKRPAFLRSVVPAAVLLMLASILLFRGWQLVMDAYVAYNPALHAPVDSRLFLLWGWRAVVQGLMLAGVYYLVQFFPMNIRFSKWTNWLAIPFLCLAVLLNGLI